MPASLDTAHQIVTNLAHRFESGKGHYLAPTYSEAQARTDFIDKFFAALDWDVSHNEQTNPAEQEVKIERGVNVGGMQKRADYAFYFNPNFRDVRFFVEAKKPSVDLNTNADAYFQTLRYGWNAQTPLAVLTDFEQFHILDCRAKPDIRTALQRAHKTYRYTDFLDKEKFAEVYWLFSREALAAGAFDRYITGLPKFKTVGKQMGLLRTSVQPVDASFLDELEQHRETLAKSFKRDNPQLDGFALTEVTQRVLDRLVFLRFLEDKQIETEVNVGSFARSATPWGEFVADSRKLNTRYNGAVYKPHSLIDNRRLTVSDDDFRDVCEKLSDKHSPYDFNAIPIHILGSIYERFLGKVIVATDKRAQVEEKPEVRKAGGVYYTPEYIVRYIVDQTVGKLIEGKTPAEIAKLRFADIACGSGSFLLGVYDTLLRYHTRWFNEHPDKAERAGCIQTEDNTWRLSLRQRRDILTNNVYGVDIDRQAVEVTQISLYLKLLEDETTASSHQYEIQFHDTLLPNLGDNIKCGNSLIGTDILTGEMFSTDEERALNAMDFEDAFPAVMKAGGFDAIVGNPPYVRQESLTNTKAYFRDHFDSYSSTADLYTYFMERGVKLLKSGGIYSIIVSSSFLRANFAKPLRNTLKKHAAVLRLVDFGGLAVFADAKDTYVCIPVLSKVPQPELIQILKVPTLDSNMVESEMEKTSYSVVHERFNSESWSLQSGQQSDVFSKIVLNCVSLGKYVDGKIFYGLKTGFNDAFVIDEKKAVSIVERENQSKQFIHRVGGGEDCRRYFIKDSHKFLIVIPAGYTKSILSKDSVPNEAHAWNALHTRFPFLSSHLQTFAPQLKSRTDKGDYWWEIRPCDYYESFQKPKIVFPDIAKNPRFTLDSTSIYLTNTAYMLGTDEKYLLGLLNSKLTWFAISNISIPFGVRANEYRYRLIYQYMEKVPIRPINFEDPQDKTKHERMVQLVTQMLDAKQKQVSAQTDHDRDYYEQRCAGLDRQIDALVYDLYGLTEDEIAIVESQK